ncbi:hypothetical protein [Palleronia sp. LCG004]|uniref:hypothetical protein n=1 Tax=Palleronia sp. LCG004 TaxID=3079304 RepID=UPI002943424D|nr:hypothetical protein [Palleronia sp. LCG004]WOI56919.1 hypothetical protein RVY76_03740 [Palleronia sp. LCG004]
MDNEWVLDVLADLKAFAEANDLCATVAKLDELCETARLEISAAEQVPLQRPTHRDATDTGKYH